MNVVYPYGSETITVAASDLVSVQSDDRVKISQIVAYPNYPDSIELVAEIQSGTYTTAAFTDATDVIIEAGAAIVHFDYGAAAAVKPTIYQGDPIALDATGALTAAMIMSGIVTSTTAAAVAGTVPTGTVMDAATSLAVGDAVDWAVINTGANTFTVTAAADHTLVGTMVVAAGAAGLFRTVKTAAGTFITYSLSNT